MNLHRLDLVSLSLFSLVVRTGSISRGAELAEGLTWQIKRRWGRIGYALAAMRVLAGARPFFPFRVKHV